MVNDVHIQTCFRLITSVLLMLAFCNCEAQVGNKIHGVVFDSGSGNRIKEATIFNPRTKVLVHADSLGEFTIVAAKGDTLVVGQSGYLKNLFVPAGTTNIKVYLSPINQLSEVKILGQSVRASMKELEKSYRDKGIFFNGRPPVYLLSPFGGSPMTFFYEMFSKDGKRARRFQKFAESEIEYSEISSRFNDAVIRTVIPDISNEELEPFKAEYWPKIEQIKAWSDFDLYSYIKKSFKQFKKK